MNREEYSVGIGFPCGDYLPWRTALSLARTTHTAGKIGVPMNLYVTAGSSDVVVARDAVLTQFLTGKENYLFWIDSDITWMPEDFFRVMALTKELGVVCAAYPIKKDSVECIINFVEPTLTDKTGCIEIQGTGLGFCCVRRDIIDAFAKTKEYMIHDGDGRELIDAFHRPRKRTADGRTHAGGEDGGFYEDLRALGHKIWLDPTICLGHNGSKEYRTKMTSLTTD